MSFPEDQVAELKLLCAEAQQCEEAGCTYLLLPGLKLPKGCSPAKTDALLCPTARDGYPFRLFFAERVQSSTKLNWNAERVRIHREELGRFLLEGGRGAPAHPDDRCLLGAPEMNVRIRLTRGLYDQVRADLARPHAFAAERVGFLFGRLGNAETVEPMILFTGYRSLDEERYINDPNSGARIDSQAIRGAMQEVINRQRGCLSRPYA